MISTFQQFHQSSGLITISKTKVKSSVSLISLLGAPQRPAVIYARVKIVPNLYNHAGTYRAQLMNFLFGPKRFFYLGSAEINKY